MTTRIGDDFKLYLPQHHLYKNVQHLELPVPVILCHAFGFASTGFHDQMFCFSDEGSNVSILPGEQIYSLGPLSFSVFTELFDTL